MKFAVINTAIKLKAVKQLIELDADVIVMSFQATKSGDLIAATGAQSVSEAAQRLSYLSNCVVIAGINAKKKSAILADKGQIRGSCEMVHDLCGNGGGGHGYRVFDTEAGKIGIIVHDDLFFPESARALALYDCEMFVSMLDGYADGAALMCRSNSFANGLNGVMSAYNSVTVTSYRGDIVYFNSGEVSAFEIDIIRDRTFLNARRKSEYAPLVSDRL